MVSGSSRRSPARVGPMTGSANQVIVRSSRLSLLNSPITRRVQYGCGPPQTLAVNPTTFTVRNKNSGPRARAPWLYDGCCSSDRMMNRFDPAQKSFDEKGLPSDETKDFQRATAAFNQQFEEALIRDP